MSLELTEREKLIIQGEDPDKTVQEVVEDQEQDAQDGAGTPSDTDAEASEEVQDEPEQVTDDQPPAWLDESSRSLAESYGLSEDELKDFSSQEEFNKFTRFVDKQLAGVGKQVLNPQKKDDPSPVEQKQTDDDLDLSKYEEKYDEDTVRIVKTLKEVREQNRMLMEERQQREAFVQQQEAVRQINAFHEAVDSLGDERFGKSISEDGVPVPIAGEADTLRRRVFETVATLAAGIDARARANGKEPVLPPLPDLVKRAYQMEFANDIAARAQQSVEAKIREQSKRRRPVAGSRGVQAPLNPKSGDLAKQIANNQDIKKLWNEFQRDNGTE